MKIHLLGLLLGLLAAAFLGHVRASAESFSGVASFYGSESGRTTASGRRFDPDAMFPRTFR